MLPVECAGPMVTMEVEEAAKAQKVAGISPLRISVHGSVSIIEH